MKSSFIMGLLIVATINVYGQATKKKSKALKYTVTYDDPYDIKKLFIHFQPIVGDIAALNIVGGFGLEANYYHKDVLDFEFSGRTSYGSKFDISRDAANRNAFNENVISTYFYGDAGATYHILDRTKESESKILLYSRRLKGTEWAATVPKNALIKNTVREIVGGRGGAFFYTSAASLSPILAKQGMDLFYNDGTPVLSDELYTNVAAYGFYVGGSMSWFKNFAVDFESRWEPNGDDLLMTTYVDVLYSPSITIDDLLIGGETVSLEDIKQSPLGFRAGLKGKFNRKLGWGYGVETGLRPGVQESGFFFAFKLSFPIYGTKLEQTVEAVNTETGE
ncbi:MAG: hypothetical protein L3J29_08690 [Cyclobacteriaceae bacterium]|nr:hypothetical protein [Cyclobacteriaceae bacterium]